MAAQWPLDETGRGYPIRTDDRALLRQARSSRRGKPRGRSGKIAIAGCRRPLLSTIKVLGERQLTYAGHPLYIDSATTKPGETSKVGTKQFGGKWYAINAKGHAVK